MKNITKRILSAVLSVTLLFCATVPVFADEFEDEEYLSDLRIIYADDYDEATEILDDSGLEGYRLLDANLNENTGKRGVFLVYKTTDDVEDAITDIAIMQMNGGYKEGNYQEMIAASYQEYLKMGEIYLEAIDYFKKAYEADNYLAKLAYRQLNFYNVVTEGIEEEPDFEGERIGDIFLGYLEASDLATMFMEGNVYALSNIRSLIAMGTSYNEDGKTYLDKVGDEAEKLTADPNVYSNENYDELAASIAPVIAVFGDMFGELEAYESELNYEDEEFTDLELNYLEYVSMAKLMSKVNYLGGKTLYEFCKSYEISSDFSDLYPLVAALNAGQLAMTKVNHYYDVVRYSVVMGESEDLDAELDAMEEKYGENPFNVYTGVDRTVYRDTFALTSEAYRADAFTESGLAAHLWGGSGTFGKAMNIAGIVGASICLVGAGVQIGFKAVISHYNNKITNMLDLWLNSSYDQTQIELLFAADGLPEFSSDTYLNWTSAQKFQWIDDYLVNNPSALDSAELKAFTDIKTRWATAQNQTPALKTLKESATNAQQAYSQATNFIYGMYIVGGLMALASAIRLGYSVYSYYNPEYDDIPTAMVDLINTADGDRYIKYDVVRMAEYDDEYGGYPAADLNAFEANRWNAMYYTKSYEAGKPLLADEFVISNNNNVPDEGYAPVHRFGEVVSYNLNKYNFNDDFSIYLSVKQSENQKSAVADVPELIGSIFSTGLIVLSGGLGIAAGAGGTIGVQEIIKRRKTAKTANTKTTE